MSKERGILFSAPMIRALLAGAKTQTRRAMKLREFGPSATNGYEWTFRDKRALWNDVSTELLVRKFCPYGAPGDRLWVRETFRVVDSEVRFRATCAEMKGETWRPSIFLPRKLSRITLEVTEVRVQRLRSISAEDVIAEGIDPEPHLCGCEPCSQTSQICPATASSLVLAYADLWRHINGPESWYRNDWVWAISFRRLP